MENSKIDMWAYLHINGTVQVELYFGPEDIKEALESDFCDIILLPKQFESKADAIKYFEGELL